ncbi:MAG: hypothetical protein L3J79_05065 [Candidatus Marinimicrobia bacterium]|nr:hypothetical protein [Candidatus Neomarinimicrobiota bacterium]
MQDALNLLTSNPLYMVVAGIVLFGIFIFLLKKVFKLAMILIIATLAYGGYLYMTEDDPMKVIQQKLDKGKSAVGGIDEATKGMRRDAIDKMIDDVDKKLKEAAKKRK